MKHGMLSPKEGQIVRFTVSDDAGSPDIRENGPVWPKCRTMLGGGHGLPSGLRLHGVSCANSRMNDCHRHASVWMVCGCMVGVIGLRLNREEDRIGGMWANDMEVDEVPGEEHRIRHGWRQVQEKVIDRWKWMN